MKISASLDKTRFYLQGFSANEDTIFFNELVDTLPSFDQQPLSSGDVLVFTPPYNFLESSYHTYINCRPIVRLFSYEQLRVMGKAHLLPQSDESLFYYRRPTFKEEAFFSTRTIHPDAYRYLHPSRYTEFMPYVDPEDVDFFFDSRPSLPSSRL